jgi:hypothetical protein
VERTPKAIETHAETMARLLKKAQEEGIALLMESDSEEHFATSGTMPGIVYRVSKQGCSCQGFRSFGRCKHYALFMDRDAFANDPIRLAERRAQRVTAQHARHIEDQARAWLTSLIAQQDAGELVKQADIDEATQAVATYAAIANPPALQAFAAD